MLKLSAKTGPFNLRSISSEDLLMNIDGIVFTSRRCALVKPIKYEEFLIAAPVVFVHQDVEAKDVIVVVEAADALLDHGVDLLVAAQDGLDDHVLDPSPKRFRVLPPLFHPGP